MKHAVAHFTTFSMPKGLFQFMVMPFILHSAGAIFQRLVDRILEPCKSFTLAYIDDIIIYSRTWAEYLGHLRQVLQRLQTVGLKINPQKSKLRFTELEYFGCTVGGGCLRPQAKKVEAIKQAL